MRSRSVAIAALLVAVLLTGATVVYAYDNGRDDLVAEGVRIGGVDVGGLRAGAAEARVRAALLAPLQDPLVVRAGDERFRLTAKEARISANISAMVAEALDASRGGNVLTRTWRGLTGGRVEADVEPDITYSRKAVQRLVDRVRVTMSRDAVNADVEIGLTDISVTEGKTGRTIDAKALRAKVTDAILATTGAREIRAKVEKVEPEVTTEEVAERHPVVITVDRANFRLRLFKNLKLSKTYPIALGEAGRETPSGVYSIANKAVNPSWYVPDSDWAGDKAGQVIPPGPDNPLKARWLGVYDGVGVHGTADRGSIGTNASKGCIRMLVEDVKELYDEVPVGAAIKIA